MCEAKKCKPNPWNTPFFVDGPCRARTYDPLSKSSILTLYVSLYFDYLQRLPLSKIRGNRRKSGIVTTFTSQLRHTGKVFLEHVNKI
jgi:hypothetical protein